VQRLGRLLASPADEEHAAGLGCRCRPGGSKTPVPSFLWRHKTGQKVHFYADSVAGYFGSERHIASSCMRLLGTSMCHLGLRPELQLPDWKWRVPLPLDIISAVRYNADRAWCCAAHTRGTCSASSLLEELEGTQMYLYTGRAARQPTCRTPRGSGHTHLNPLIFTTSRLLPQRLASDDKAPGRSAIPTPSLG
jgi:hypothetical protein